MVVLGSMAASSVLRAESLKGAHDASGISSALNHFGVSQENMKKVLAAALEKGGDYADLFFEHTFNKILSVSGLISGQSLIFGPNWISTLGSATPLLSNTRFS